MATPLDIGLLQYFMPIFSWLFVFVLLYAILEKTGIMGENKALSVVAAVSIATITVLYTQIAQLISFVAPWMVFIFIFILLLFGGLMFFGVKQEELWKELSIWTVFVISFFIILIGLTQTYSEIFNPYGPANATKTIQSETLKTLFHPRVLGAIFMLIISALAIKFISSKVKNP